MHDFALTENWSVGEREEVLQDACLLRFIANSGIAFNTMDTAVKLMVELGLVREMDSLYALRRKVLGSSCERLGSVQLRRCLVCGAYSIAPYIFCQDCWKEGKMTRLLQGCQCDGCLAKNDTFRNLPEEKIREHVKDTCTHSRNSTVGDGYVLESLHCVIGDLIGEGLLGLIKDSSPIESLLKLDYIGSTGWASCDCSYNRFRSYLKLGMFQHAERVAGILQDVMKEDLGPSKLHEGLSRFVEADSPERRIGLNSE